MAASVRAPRVLRKKLALTKARELREYNEAHGLQIEGFKWIVVRCSGCARARKPTAWQPFCCGKRMSKSSTAGRVNSAWTGLFWARMKADLDRAVGLEPVKVEDLDVAKHVGLWRSLSCSACGMPPADTCSKKAWQYGLMAVWLLGKQPRRHVLISGAFGVGKHVAADLIGRLFGLLNNQLVAGGSERLASSGQAAVRLGSRVRLAAWQDAENRGPGTPLTAWLCVRRPAEQERRGARDGRAAAGVAEALEGEGPLRKGRQLSP